MRVRNRHDVIKVRSNVTSSNLIRAVLLQIDLQWEHMTASQPRLISNQEKLLAALRGGINKVLIPIENEKDLKDIPDRVKAGIEIIPVSHVSEVLKHALVSQPKAIEWDAEAEEAKALAMLEQNAGSSAVAH